MNRTRISYATHAANPVRGCSPVGAGCAHCWSLALAARFARVEGSPWYGLVDYGHGLLPISWTGEVRFDLSAMMPVLRARRPGVVFACSQSDLFHPNVTDEQIAAVYGVMAACPQHTFLVLTKRPERRRAWFEWLARESLRCNNGRGMSPAARCFVETQRRLPTEIAPQVHRNTDVPCSRPWPLPNVWDGASAWDQPSADEAIPHLLATPAAHRWVSLEPLLDEVNLRLGRDTLDMWSAAPPIDWVCVGGESGHHARPCDVAWIRDVVRQCKAAGTAVYCKQLGSRPFAVEGSETARSWPSRGVAPMDDCGGIHPRDRAGADPSEWPEDLRVRDLPWRTP